LQELFVFESFDQKPIISGKTKLLKMYGKKFVLKNRYRFAALFQRRESSDGKWKTLVRKNVLFVCLRRV
jgi:hypothetical protein